MVSLRRFGAQQAGPNDGIQAALAASVAMRTRFYRPLHRSLNMKEPGAGFRIRHRVGERWVFRSLRSGQ